MDILKADFQAALDLDEAAEAAQTIAQDKKQESRDKRDELTTYLASLGFDPADPFHVVLVEHEGTVYQVSSTDIKPLVVRVTV